ncbi:MAG TPA: TfoX/Sxy family protein [Patescibacteria group bacterium]|nr:TfoX/Sxy family protein [Patescibacteria group bacterium]
MSALSKLPNVGKVLEDNLRSVGIETPEQLRELGAVETFRRIRLQRDPGACLHMLYGIQGAILGIPDKQLPPEIKQELKALYRFQCRICCE